MDTFNKDVDYTSVDSKDISMIDMTISEVRLLIEDVVKFVEDGSGIVFSISEINENLVPSSELNAKDDAQNVVEYNILNSSKARSVVKCRLLYLNSESDECRVNKCEVLFNSPLHSRHKDQWTSVNSSGDMVDYLLLHMNPDLLLIRSLQYLSFLVSLQSPTKTKKNQLCITSHYDEDAMPKLKFEIENSDSQQHIILVFPSFASNESERYPVIKNSDKKEHDVKLDSFTRLGYYDAVLFKNEEHDFVEHGFAVDFKAKVFMPHPVTTKSMNLVLGSIGLGSLGIYGSQ